MHRATFGRLLQLAITTVVAVPVLTLSAEQSQRTIATVPFARRAALVIANNSYSSSLPSLENATNDGKAFADRLQSVGFTVQTHFDADRRSMERAIDTFVAGLRSTDVALFYYAGHGLEFEDVHYLVPTDFRGIDYASTRVNAYPLPSNLSNNCSGTGLG